MPLFATNLKSASSSELYFLLNSSENKHDILWESTCNTTVLPHKEVLYKMF